MRAVRLHELTGADGLVLEDVPEPRADAGEVLVDVLAAGVGFVDLLTAKGLYQVRPELPFIPASELVGRRRDTGERVAAVAWHSALAEVAAVPSDTAFVVPDAMSDAQAAALPVNFQTGHLAVVGRGGLVADETVLVHGGAGGVGTAAIQVAKAAGAGTVIATASSGERRDVALACGADHALGPQEDWVTAVKDLTGGAGVDVVVDPVGGEVLTQSLRAMATGGRAMVVGFAGGAIPEVKVNRLLLRHHAVIGVNFALVTPAQARAAHDDLIRWHEQGFVRPVISAVYELEDAGDAYRAFEERTVVGRPVVRVSADA